jgi:hypothetical protein
MLADSEFAVSFLSNRLLNMIVALGFMPIYVWWDKATFSDVTLNVIILLSLFLAYETVLLRSCAFIIRLLAALLLNKPF